MLLTVWRWIWCGWRSAAAPQTPPSLLRSACCLAEGSSNGYMGSCEASCCVEVCRDYSLMMTGDRATMQMCRFPRHVPFTGSSLRSRTCTRRCMGSCLKSTSRTNKNATFYSERLRRCPACRKRPSGPSGGYSRPRALRSDWSHLRVWKEFTSLARSVPSTG